jgi:hypothetical protein
MKIFLLLFSTLALNNICFAETFPHDLVGNYRSVNCLYYSDLNIFKKDNLLIVEGQRANSDLWAFTEKVVLGTNGKNFDCTPGGSYGDVQCRVKIKNNLLVSEERGCLIACGPWHLKLSLQKMNSTQVGIKLSNEQQQVCIFQAK